MFNYNPSLLPHPERNKIIILCGEKRKVTGFQGDVCFSWFDVYTFDVFQ